MFSTHGTCMCLYSLCEFENYIGIYILLVLVFYRLCCHHTDWKASMNEGSPVGCWARASLFGFLLLLLLGLLGYLFLLGCEQSAESLPCFCQQAFLTRQGLFIKFHTVCKHKQCEVWLLGLQHCTSRQISSLFKTLPSQNIRNMAVSIQLDSDLQDTKQTLD